MNESSTISSASNEQLRTLWQNFLAQKSHPDWQKALLKMVALDNFPADLRLEIGRTVMAEAPNMAFDLRQDAYCAVTWKVPELAAVAWKNAQAIGLNQGDLELFILTHRVKSAVSLDTAKDLIQSARKTLTNLSRTIGKKVEDTLETSPFHDVFKQMKDLT